MKRYYTTIYNDVFERRKAIIESKLKYAIVLKTINYRFPI